MCERMQRKVILPYFIVSLYLDLLKKYQTGLETGICSEVQQN